MIKYIFNTDGDYVAYIYNSLYCFSKDNKYIGFMIGIYLYDSNGNYLGYLTSDDRIIRKKNDKKIKMSPIAKPTQPIPPLSPLKRYKMSDVGPNYIDVFKDVEVNLNYEELDYKYMKFIDCRLYDYNGKFIGKLSLNKYDVESIANPYGIYGNQYNSESVFNKYGPYGSQYSSLSPFNPFSSTPLIIKDNYNNTIALVSNNNHLNNVINATEFFNWFKSKID